MNADSATQEARWIWSRLKADALRDDPAMARDWDRLNARRGDLPFMSAHAIAAAVEAFGDDSEALLVARSGTQAVAMFVLQPLGPLKWQTFQPSQLPLGAWVSEPDIALTRLARSLLRGPLGFCLVLSITQVDPRLCPRGDDGGDSQHDDYIDTAWVDVGASFDDYWSARGKNLRQNMRKQRTKLVAEGVAGRMRTWSDPADIGAAIARYGELESAGWKASQGTAIHPNNAQGRFYRKLLEEAAKRGEAVVYEYLFDDRPVAMNMCLRRAGTLVVLKTTYDESIKSYSPAFMLSEDQLKQVFGESSIDRVEYYGRLMEWHTRWTENKRTLYHLTMYRWPFVKQLAGQRARARQRKAGAALEHPT